MKVSPENLDKFRAILDRRTSINSVTGCWEYQNTDGYGYGRVQIDNENYGTHILSAMLFLMYIPTNGSMVCHRDEVCKSKACWNPDHLYVGDAFDNNWDKHLVGNARSRYSDVTHCVKGHEFTPENTYLSKRKETGKMQRNCIKCQAIRTKEYQMRQRKKGK